MTTKFLKIHAAEPSMIFGLLTASLIRWST
jgi:hypothetical protein